MGLRFRLGLVKFADDVQQQQPANFNQNIYDAMKSRGSRFTALGGLGALGGIAGAALGNKYLGLGGALVGATGLLAGHMASSDAAKYKENEDFRKKVNSPGLLNNYNDLAIGGKLGVPSWMM